MAKPQPPLEPEHFYHVYNHANGDDNIFRADENYRFFLKLYSTYISGIADTFAYCLMPNHFHFVVRIKPENELKKFYQENKEQTLPALQTLAGLIRLNSLQFSHFFNAYAQAFNKQQQRMGSLFNEPFKRHKVTSVEYLLNLIHYVHNNPVHHGFVKNMNDWKFSSYSAFLSSKKTMLAKKELMKLIGGTKGFREFHQRNLTNEFLRTVNFE